MFRAAATGDFATLVKICNQGHDIFVYDHDFDTPLHQAAINGHHELVQYFIDKGSKKSIS